VRSWQGEAVGTRPSPSCGSWQRAASQKGEGASGEVQTELAQASAGRALQGPARRVAEPLAPGGAATPLGARRRKGLQSVAGSAQPRAEAGCRRPASSESTRQHRRPLSSGPLLSGPQIPPARQPHRRRARRRAWFPCCRTSSNPGLIAPAMCQRVGFRERAGYGRSAALWCGYSRWVGKPYGGRSPQRRSKARPLQTAEVPVCCLVANLRHRQSAQDALSTSAPHGAGACERRPKTKGGRACFPRLSSRLERGRLLTPSCALKPCLGVLRPWM